MLKLPQHLRFVTKRGTFYETVKMKQWLTMTSNGTTDDGVWS